MSTENQAPQRRPPLVITSEEQFRALMEDIDREMIAEGVRIPARPLLAGLKITDRYDIVLNAVPGDRPILPGVFTPDQISLRIHDWMRNRYGERLKMSFTIGSVVVPLRGVLYSIKCPVVYGTVKFVCEPDTFGQPRPRIGRRSAPTCNILDLIDDFTADLACSLTAEEVVKIGLAHASAMGAFTALNVVTDVQFVEEALGDLDAAANHLMEDSPQLGLSKWASLQAAEKLLKAYIVTKGGSVKHHHKLKDHFHDAAKLGLPAPAAQYITDLQCPASVRYGKLAVSVDEAGIAHLLSLEVCEVAARAIGLALNRHIPDVPQPTIDGMPAKEFLDRYATTS